MHIEITARPKKRLFLALILASLLLAVGSTVGIWMVSIPGLADISKALPVLLGIGLAIVALTAIGGVAGIVLAIMGFHTPRFFLGQAWSVINLLFPTAIRIGKIFDIEKETVERSFIEVSNHLVRQKLIRVKPERLLILTPHCIQKDTCPHKITRNANNCKRCGQCQVDDLLKLTEKYGVNLAVVTGGTLARNVLKNLRPQAVLAIACERDLTSGIQDVFPLPVIGVLNQRPFGPCCNTRVDIERVDELLHDMIVLQEERVS
jgi:uncharacterized protein